MCEYVRPPSCCNLCSSSCCQILLPETICSYQCCLYLDFLKRTHIPVWRCMPSQRTHKSKHLLHNASFQYDKLLYLHADRNNQFLTQDLESDISKSDDVIRSFWARRTSSKTAALLQRRTLLKCQPQLSRIAIQLSHLVFPFGRVPALAQVGMVDLKFTVFQPLPRWGWLTTKLPKYHYLPCSSPCPGGDG